MEDNKEFYLSSHQKYSQPSDVSHAVQAPPAVEDVEPARPPEARPPDVGSLASGQMETILEREDVQA